MKFLSPRSMPRSLRQHYEPLEKKIKIKFTNYELIDTAFVHASYLNEHRGEKPEHNERLEFLGDAVLELVTTEYLYHAFPDAPEGELTALRSALVKGKHLSEVADKLGLGKYLYLSHGEERSGGREKSYLLANVLEAFIGALYLDLGFKKTHAFIDAFILKNLKKILEKGGHVDAKSHFQELAQERVSITPVYKVVSEEGPDHRKIFTVGAYLAEKCVAKGKGSSKQEAEEEAALGALREMGWLH